jgi:NAD(P)-dependent dehydrogenase (short-subunit alcohol dehydrogenase family)
MRIKLKPLNKQVVVVFGASSGIGRQTALDFAERGAKAFVSARSETGLASLVEEIEEKGGSAYYMTADAANFSDVEMIAKAAYERFGGIDTWAHVAGTTIFAPFEQTTPEEFKRVIEVNLLGQAYGAMAALPYLRKNGGALIHVSSVEAFRTLPFQTAYGASKHGIRGFVESLRLELEKERVPISVTEILPAIINTPIWDKGRNKFSHKIKPPVQPVYHPKVVSEAILFAAENPVRDIVAGGGALGVPLMERISPSLTDKITRFIGFNQLTEEEHSPNSPDSLFEPVSELDSIEGRFSDEQFKSDPYVWAKTNPQKVNLLLAGGFVGGVLAYLMLKKK